MFYRPHYSVGSMILRGFGFTVSAIGAMTVFGLLITKCNCKSKKIKKVTTECCHAVQNSATTLGHMMNQCACSINDTDESNSTQSESSDSNANSTNFNDTDVNPNGIQNNSQDLYSGNRNHNTIHEDTPQDSGRCDGACEEVPLGFYPPTCTEQGS